jgi:tetratricopeptide (TPR) repeat protein
LLIALGKVEEGIAALERAMKMAPAETWITRELLTALRGVNRDLDGLRAVEYCIDKAGADPFLLGWKGQVLLDLGEHEDAIEAASAALALPPQAAWLFGLRGWAHQIMGDPKAAHDDFAAASALEPEDLWHQKGVADALIATGAADARERFSAIREAARKEADADAPEGLALIGWCEYRLGNFDEAIHVFGQALVVNSLFVSIQFDLALATLGARQERRALSEYQRGIKIAEHNEGLRAASSIRVAMHDVLEATRLHPAIDALEVTADIRDLLQRGLAKAQSEVRTQRARQTDGAASSADQGATTSSASS